MVTFFETKSNGNRVMINILQVQLIEPVRDSNECLIRFASGEIEDIIVDEHFDAIKAKIGEMAKY